MTARSCTAIAIGSEQTIHPGDVNWMTAGRGIAHSERAPADERGNLAGSPASRPGLRCRRAREEAPPSFAHHGNATACR